LSRIARGIRFYVSAFCRGPTRAHLYSGVRRETARHCPNTCRLPYALDRIISRRATARQRRPLLIPKHYERDRGHIADPMFSYPSIRRSSARTGLGTSERTRPPPVVYSEGWQAGRRWAQACRAEEQPAFSSLLRAGDPNSLSCLAPRRRTHWVRSRHRSPEGLRWNLNGRSSLHAGWLPHSGMGHRAVRTRID